MTENIPRAVDIPIELVGDELEVPCIDGAQRRYVNLDAAASTSALAAVASRLHDFVPWYSSVHRGAGYKSRVTTEAYEAGPGRDARIRAATADSP